MGIRVFIFKTDNQNIRMDVIVIYRLAVEKENIERFTKPKTAEGGRSKKKKKKRIAVATNEKALKNSITHQKICPMCLS